MYNAYVHVQKLKLEQDAERGKIEKRICSVKPDREQS